MAAYPAVSDQSGAMGDDRRRGVFAVELDNSPDNPDGGKEVDKARDLDTDPEDDAAMRGPLGAAAELQPLWWQAGDWSQGSQRREPPRGEMVLNIFLVNQIFNAQGSCVGR